NGFGDQDRSSQLLLQHHVCLPSSMLPAMMIMDQPSETASKPLTKYFFL
ncbi:hypothetical protein LEMLEM_LOCUS11757, partial [Lemmus lemmus]